MIWGSGGSKSRLAKAAGAEPAGQMRDEKLHAVVARSTFRSQHVQNTPHSDQFWKLRCSKVCASVARRTFRSQKCKKLRGSEDFWTFKCRFAWQAHGIAHLVKVGKTCGFCRISKNNGRRGTFEEDLQRSGADSLRRVAFWSIRSSGLLK